MNDVSKDVRNTVETGLNELERIADEIRVRLHLGGMEAKDAWKKLEPQLEDARQHARDATDASHKALTDVLEAFKTFRASL